MPWRSSALQARAMMAYLPKSCKVCLGQSLTKAAQQPRFPPRCYSHKSAMTMLTYIASRPFYAQTFAAGMTREQLPFSRVHSNCQAQPNAGPTHTCVSQALAHPSVSCARLRVHCDHAAWRHCSWKWHCQSGSQTPCRQRAGREHKRHWHVAGRGHRHRPGSDAKRAVACKDASPACRRRQS